ncbi:MAG: nitroreductase family protein [Pricia sp.]
MIDTIKNLEWRYAVKKFNTDSILSEEKVEGLKQAFNLTATSYGLQPITMLVLRDKALQNKLVAHSYGQLQVAQASHVLVICIQDAIDKDYITSYFERVKKIRGTSDSILEPFKDAMVADFSKKDIQEIRHWAKNQAYLALGNLLTICAMEKIDSCPMEGFDPMGYAEVLQLASRGLAPVLVLPVGYRADDDMFSEFKKVRKDLKDSVIDIKL